MLRVISAKRLAGAAGAYASSNVARPPINPLLKKSKVNNEDGSTYHSGSSSNLKGVNMSTVHGALGEKGDTILDKALLFAGLCFVGWWWFCVELTPHRHEGSQQK